MSPVWDMHASTPRALPGDCGRVAVRLPNSSISSRTAPRASSYSSPRAIERTRQHETCEETFCRTPDGADDQNCSWQAEVLLLREDPSQCPDAGIQTCHRAHGR